MQTTQPQKISLLLNTDLIPRFFICFRQGVVLEGEVECSAGEFLCRQYGLNREYIDRRVQTVFLDAKPVDDIHTVIIRSGSTLALSTAMPGLAGATLRKGGFFAGMRKGISFEGDSQHRSKRQGQIVLKLFNRVAEEVGPVLLEKGVRIKGQSLGEVFNRHADAFRAGCVSVGVDGREADIKCLSGVAWVEDPVFVRIRSHGV